jgi:hypothetical protein
MSKKLETAVIELKDGRWMIREKYQVWRPVTRDDIKKREWIGTYVDPNELPK